MTTGRAGIDEHLSGNPVDDRVDLREHTSERRVVAFGGNRRGALGKGESSYPSDVDECERSARAPDTRWMPSRRAKWSFVRISVRSSTSASTVGTSGFRGRASQIFALPFFAALFPAPVNGSGRVHGDGKFSGGFGRHGDRKANRYRKSS